MSLAKLTLFLSALLVLSGCTLVIPANQNQYRNVDTSDLSDLEHLTRDEKLSRLLSQEVNPVRYQALQETGMSVGAQGALARRSQEINDYLEKSASQLDLIFNFRALVLANDVLPPVIQEGREIYNQPDPSAIRVADKTYKILRQAQFAANPPNWREYLWLSYNKPEVPEPTLLPRAGEQLEVDAWKKSVDEGWQQGTKQANDIFAENLARLRRDYQGMLLYRKLLEQRMISEPIVASTDLGITGGGEEMSIHDRFFRIAANPSLNANGAEGAPAITQELYSLSKDLPAPEQEAVLNKDGASIEELEAQMEIAHEG